MSALYQKVGRGKLPILHRLSWYISVHLSALCTEIVNYLIFRFYRVRYTATACKVWKRIE